MKKKVLSLSIAAMIGGLGLAGSASAAVFAPIAADLTAVPNTFPPIATDLVDSTDGRGHILFVPYYSTQGGNVTLFSIVNTDQRNGKAVKVRFRGASNSDDVLDFQVYLSPGDVWVAEVNQGDDGYSFLKPRDASCTIPADLKTNGSRFSAGRIDDLTMSEELKAANTREGYIEILNMADVAPGIPASNPLFKTIRHVAGTPDCDPDVFEALKVDPDGMTAAGGTTADGVAQGLTFPTGKLFANWIIMNQLTTTTFTGEAPAVVAVEDAGAANRVSGTGNMVFFPQIPTEITTTVVGNTGASAPQDVNYVTADPLFRTDSFASLRAGGQPDRLTSRLLTPAVYEFPDMSTPYVDPTGLGAVPATAALDQSMALTRSIARTSVANEYYTESTTLGKTDMLFVMPTRRYHVAMHYQAPLARDGRVFTNYDAAAQGAYSTTTTSPYFSTQNTSIGTNAQICVAVKTVGQWDREETTTSTGFEVSPGTPNKIRLCGEASVIGVNAASASPTPVLKATVAASSLKVQNQVAGWLSYTLEGSVAANGLPLLGSAFQTFNNPKAGPNSGLAATYGVRYQHRYVNVVN